jgi:hypothetical protein
VYGLGFRVGSGGGNVGPTEICNPAQSNTNVPAANCNNRFVYAGSDYTRYMKQKAMNKNYNDTSYAGNENNANQSVFRMMRR